MQKIAKCPNCGEMVESVREYFDVDMEEDGHIYITSQVFCSACFETNKTDYSHLCFSREEANKLKKQMQEDIAEQQDERYGVSYHTY